MNRQTISTPMTLTACASPARVWAKQPTMMIISSTPSGGSVRNLHRRETIVLTHALPAYDVCKPSEEELADESTDGGGNLDTKIQVGRKSTRVFRCVDIAQHDGRNVDLKRI